MKGRISLATAGALEDFARSLPPSSLFPRCQSLAKLAQSIRGGLTTEFGSGLGRLSLLSDAVDREGALSVHEPTAASA